MVLRGLRRVPVSSKFSIVKRKEKPVQKHVSCMNLREFRFWKFCQIRSDWGFWFDMKRMNDEAYMTMIRPTGKLTLRRGSSKGYGVPVTVTRKQIAAALDRMVASSRGRSSVSHI